MKSLRSIISTLVALTVLLWALELVNVVSGNRLDELGALHPRTAAGIWQIFTAPFLHGSWSHLIANTIGLWLVGSLTLLEGAFFEVTLLSIIVGGVGVWLFAAPYSVELGFSGALFGMMGYLMARGIFDRRPRPILMSLLALSWFGGSMGLGLMPQNGISWAGHFWGLVGGLFAARILQPDRRS